jgi:hypothetical protein
MAPVFTTKWENDLFRLLKRLLFQKTLPPSSYQLLRTALVAGRRATNAEKEILASLLKVLGPKAFDDKGKLLLFDDMKGNYFCGGGGVSTVVKTMIMSSLSPFSINTAYFLGLKDLKRTNRQALWNLWETVGLQDTVEILSDDEEEQEEQEEEQGLTLASLAAKFNKMKLEHKSEVDALKAELEELKNAETNGAASLTEADVRAIVVEESGGNLTEARVLQLADGLIQHENGALVNTGYVQDAIDPLASRNYVRWLAGETIDFLRQERATSTASRASMVLMDVRVDQLAETVAAMEERLSGVEFYQEEQHHPFLEQRREVQNMQYLQG